MLRVLILFISLTALPMFGGSVQLLTLLPNAAVSKAIQLDPAGNIYLAGSLTPQNPQSSQDTSDAFVAKAGERRGQVSAAGPISSNTVCRQ